MHILIKRLFRGQNSTLSIVKIDGVKFCFCLEDKDRDLSAEMSEEKILEIKVKEKTAIPTGAYQVIVTHSTRFKRRMPLLLNVPGFAGIRIHSGNRHIHTEGCPLFGRRWEREERDYIVLESRSICDEFYKRVNQALKENKKITCEIIQAYENSNPKR